MNSEVNAPHSSRLIEAPGGGVDCSRQGCEREKEMHRIEKMGFAIILVRRDSAGERN